MATSIRVRLPPVDRPDALTSGSRSGTPSPGPTTYPRVTGSFGIVASLDHCRGADRKGTSRRHADATVTIPSSTLLALAVARLLGVPVKRDHQAERSPPPPLVASDDTRTTSPHPHPPDRLRRGPPPIHPPQRPAPLGPELPAWAAFGRQAQVDPADGRPARQG